MATPLLVTKLHIPRLPRDPSAPLRTRLVPRPRLIERLNEGFRSGHKLTLVSAPAGFGKATLVAEAAEARLFLEVAPPDSTLLEAWLRGGHFGRRICRDRQPFGGTLGEQRTRGYRRSTPRAAVCGSIRSRLKPAAHWPGAGGQARDLRAPRWHDTGRRADPPRGG
jgi:hypothetical protein